MDPISLMLTTIKNGSLAGKTTLSVAHSQIKEAILECLKRCGFIADYEKKTRYERLYLDITLIKNGTASRISDVKRISKPSRRLYKGVKEIRTFKNGKGAFVFSTPKGILSDKEAKKEQVGGEIM